MNYRHLGKSLINLIKSADYRFRFMATHGFFKNMDDESYLKRMFKAQMGYELDLSNPQTFNEKLQWLKLHDRKPSYTTMVDKYAVKEYVACIIGEEHIIPTLGVWNKAEDIDFDSLPNQFVLKCTHDSAGLVICRDKSTLDIKAAKKKLKKRLKRNFYYKYREWPYKDVPPRIIAEKYMEDSRGKGDLTDYKLFYFSGELKAIMVVQDRFSKDGAARDYYTPDWKHYDFTRGNPNAPMLSPRPPELDKLVEIGSKLAGDCLHIRVDLYVIDHKIYFGELTYYDYAGFKPFHPEKYDYEFGSFIKLPVK